MCKRSNLKQKIDASYYIKPVYHNLKEDKVFLAPPKSSPMKSADENLNGLIVINSPK